MIALEITHMMFNTFYAMMIFSSRQIDFFFFFFFFFFCCCFLLLLLSFCFVVVVVLFFSFFFRFIQGHNLETICMKIRIIFSAEIKEIISKCYLICIFSELFLSTYILNNIHSFCKLANILIRLNFDKCFDNYIISCCLLPKK